MGTNINANSAYKILSIKELGKIEEAKKLEIAATYIVEYNGAFAIIFKDGTSILRPPILGGNEGFFFYKVESMDEMVKSRIYPVKDSNSFWEKEKHRVLNFLNAMPFYCSKLTELLDYTVELKTDKVYLKELSTIITKALKSKKNNKILINYLSIYIGELLRKKVNGEWRLRPQPAFTVYYIPEIICNNTFSSHWNIVIGDLENAAYIPVDIEEILDKINVFYPIGNRNYVEQ